QSRRSGHRPSARGWCWASSPWWWAPLGAGSEYSKPALPQASGPAFTRSAVGRKIARMEALLFWLVLGLALGAGVVWARGLRAWASAGAVLLAVARGGGQGAGPGARGRRGAPGRGVHAARPRP